MQRFQKILVGVAMVAKGEKVALGSQKAVEQAIWIARHWSGVVTLVHSNWRGRRTEEAEEELADLPEAGRRALQDLVERCTTAGVACQLEFTRERPWLYIVRAALRGEADLVLIGKRNTEQGNRRLGSTAVKLLRMCPCPIWAVRAEHDLAHKLVLAATDLSPVGDLVVRFGAQLASVGEGELHVLHAYRVGARLRGAASSMSEEEYQDAVDAIKRSAKEQIRAQLGDIALATEAEIHLSRSTPSTAIREAVEHLQPDLLVMGSLSKGGEPGFLIGTTAEKLLERLDCSLLAVKPDDFVSPVALDERDEREPAGD